MQYRLGSGWSGEIFVADEQQRTRLFHITDLGLSPKYNPRLKADPKLKTTTLVWTVRGKDYSHDFNSPMPELSQSDYVVLKVKVLTST